MTPGKPAIGASVTAHELAERLGVPSVWVVTGWEALHGLGLPAPRGDRWPAAAVQALLAADGAREQAADVLRRLFDPDGARDCATSAQLARRVRGRASAPPAKASTDRARAGRVRQVVAQPAPPTPRPRARQAPLQSPSVRELAGCLGVPPAWIARGWPALRAAGLPLPEQGRWEPAKLQDLFANPAAKTRAVALLRQHLAGLPVFLSGGRVEHL